MPIIIPSLRRGASFWQVTLTSGKEIIEGEVVSDLLRGDRSVDWFLDIASTDDCAHIKRVDLITPGGKWGLDITEPYSAFQFKQGFLSFTSGKRACHSQIVGRVDNRETGACTCVVWDAISNAVSINHRTSLLNFISWRKGTPDLGLMNYEAMGVRLT